MTNGVEWTVGSDSIRCYHSWESHSFFDDGVGTEGSVNWVFSYVGSEGNYPIRNDKLNDLSTYHVAMYAKAVEDKFYCKDPFGLTGIYKISFRGDEVNTDYSFLHTITPKNGVRINDMNINGYIKEFAEKSHRYKPYSKICKKVLLGGMPYSLNSQDVYEESEYLPLNIKYCVQKYSSTKDTAIELFKDLVVYLEKKGVDIPEIKWPPVPVSNTFERLMFIAKYLQEKENRISKLTDILWVNRRTVEDDLSRLRGNTDPIQVCGKKFCIPDMDRKNNRIYFPSTAHPLFLAENLTQVLILLKGLKEMAENPLYRPYAEETAGEIWTQLSPYAKDRICFVLREMLPEDCEWYLSLGDRYDDNHFHSEEDVSTKCFVNTNVVLDCLKNGKSFCAEYRDDEGIHFYKDCVIEEGSYRSGPPGIVVNCSEGQVRLELDKIIRSTYTVEELVSD